MAAFSQVKLLFVNIYIYIYIFFNKKRGSKNCTIAQALLPRWCVCVDNGVSRDALTRRSLSSSLTPWQRWLPWWCRQRGMLHRSWLTAWRWFSFSAPGDVHRHTSRARLVFSVWCALNGFAWLQRSWKKKEFEMKSVPLPMILCRASFAFYIEPQSLTCGSDDVMLD